MGAMLAQRAATLATYRHTGLYVSQQLELHLVKLSNKLRDKKSSLAQVKAGSTLHVLSRTYETGGHTRVVERWIEASPTNDIHSVFLTRSRKVTPKLTEQLASHSGVLYSCKTFSSILGRARRLRQISNTYTRVVLHIHMDDIVPMIAYSGIQRPYELIHFNHADHRFWVGAALPDIVMEMRSWGAELSREKRGIANSAIRGIPYPIYESEDRQFDWINREQTRSKLGIEMTAKVMLTVGRADKYIDDSSTLVDLITQQMRHQENLAFIAIGSADLKNSIWKPLVAEFGSRVRLFGVLSRDEYMRYVAIADVGIDSFPMSGGTAMLDSFTAGLPVLALRCPTGHFDFIRSSYFYATDEEDWRTKVTEILNWSREIAKKEIGEVLHDAARYVDYRHWGAISLADKGHSPLVDSDLVSNEFNSWKQLDDYLVASAPSLAKFLF